MTVTSEGVEAALCQRRHVSLRRGENASLESCRGRQPGFKSACCWFAATAELKRAARPTKNSAASGWLRLVGLIVGYAIQR
jgi:hypothetical protein